MIRINLHKPAIALLIIALLFGMVLGSTSVSAQASDGTIAVSPTEVSLEQGESQTITVTYKRESDATPQGIEYTLTYDPNVISVTDQEQGSYLGGTAFINNVSSPGEVEYTEAILDGEGVETTNGTVATITVEAASDVDDGATAPLEFTTAKASEGATEFTITSINGTVEAEVPNQADDPTDNDSDSEETTGENADTEETTDDTENDGTRTEDVDNSTSENEDRTEAELNETADSKTSSSTASEQPANDSSTDDGTTSGDDTSGAIPGFGVKLTLIAVLAVTYIIGRKTY